MKNVFSKVLFLLLAVTATSSVLAANPSPLNNDDEIAVFLHGVLSNERADNQIRIRAAICVEFNKCKEITITPVIKVAAGEEINFDKKEVKARRSQVFSGKEINERIAKLASEKNVANPKPQIAVMMVRVDASGKVLEKSDSAYLDFPKKDESGEVAKGATTSQLKNAVEVKLHKVEAKLSVVINRKVAH